MFEQVAKNMTQERIKEVLAALKKLTPNQQSVFANMINDGVWSTNKHGWYFGNVSNTKKMLNSLSKKGLLIEEMETKQFPKFSETYYHYKLADPSLKIERHILIKDLIEGLEKLV